MKLPASQSTVFVGVTTRNRAAILPRALASALAQDYPQLKVAVLDDGSTDGTSGLKGQFPGVRWERNETSSGIIKGRNHLMQTAGCDYYVSLDDDAWFLRSDEIAVAVSRMEEDDRVGAIAFDILSPDRTAETARTEPRPCAMFIGCGHLLRLSAVREAGYYAAAPGTYGSEEKDLALRLADLGYKIQLLPGVHVWHDQAWAGRDWFPLHRSGVCNELVMTLRRCPLPDLLIVLPLKFASYAWFWLRNPGYLFAGLAGLLDFLRHGRYAVETRQPVKRSTFWRMRRGGA